MVQYCDKPRKSWKLLLSAFIITLSLMLGSCGPPNIEKLSEKKDFEELAEILENDEQEMSVRLEAAAALGMSESRESVSSLAHTFYETENKPLKEACLDALVQIDNRQAASWLMDGVMTKPLMTKEIKWYDEATVQLAMEGLVEIGDETVELIEDVYMERILSQEGYEKIVSLLGQIGGKESFQLLARLHGKVQYLKPQLATKAMSSMVEADDDLADYLPNFLVHTDPDVRKAAASMLPITGNEQSVDILIKTLHEDSDEGVRYAAAWALDQLGDPRSVEALLQGLKDEESKRVNQNIISALGHIGSKRAVEGLIQALGEDFDLHHSLVGYIARALVKNGDKALEPLLDHILNEEGRAVQQEIGDALVEIGDASIIDPLIQGVQDSSKDVHIRMRIAYVLGEMDDERAIPALISALVDGVPTAHDLRKLFDNDVEKLLVLLENRKTVNIYPALIYIGKSGTETALIKALIKFGDKSMAETFLNSGNTLLEEAAEKWAEDHGYRVFPGGGGGTFWGEG